MNKKRLAIIIVAAVVVAGIGCAAGMMMKTSMAGKADVSLDEAKQIALASVGVSEEKATFTKEEFDEGTYEIDFYTESNKYDFEISASTGAIIDRETSARNLTVPDSSADVQATEPATAPADQNSTDDDVIGVEAAKDIALSHAGVSSASFTEAYLDYDDGVRVYDIDFIADGRTYEYEINAITGAVLSFDSERAEADDYYDD